MMMMMMMMLMVKVMRMIMKIVMMAMNLFPTPAAVGDEDYKEKCQ